MKKFLKIIGIIVIIIIVVIAGGAIYFNSAYPDVDPPEQIKVEITDARLARGKYLAHNVTMCIDCHSKRDWTKFSGPVVPGTEGQGGDIIDEKTFGFPGILVPKNITPAHIGNWTDGELMRAITCGVAKDDDPIFPLMPYSNFNKMTREDIFSLVAYIKSLQPKKNNLPERELNFPLNFIIKTMPVKSYTPAEEVDRNNTIAYGEYLVTIASCGDCHTQSVEGKPVEGMAFAGGQVFPLPFGTIRSANITPHEKTGIGAWTKEQFINRFKSFNPDSVNIPSVKTGEFNTIMPWTLYSGMTEADLGAIYDYLKTLKPVYNQVNKFTPPAKPIAMK